MKVEFLVNTGLGDGRQILIQAAEFMKGKNDIEEFNSFAFSTQSFFSLYGIDRIIFINEYKYILKLIEKNDAVIITAVEENYPRRVYPQVYIVSNGRLKPVDLDEVRVKE